MKVTLNGGTHDLKDLKKRLRAEFVELSGELGEYVAKEAKTNAPRIDGTDSIADSIEVVKATDVDEPTKVISNHPASLRVHETENLKIGTDPKDQSSKTGGTGNKFLERAVYQSAPTMSKTIKERIASVLTGKI